jgi:hypothetical protein
MGAIGKGNNMTGVQIALDLASQARIPFLFIDPKGEFVADGRPIGPFVGLSNVGAMEAGTDPVPLDFHARSENFNDATPTMVWDLLLRALGLRTVLAEEGANPGFREEATKNLRRFIQELMEWDAKVRAISRR